MMKFRKERFASKTSNLGPATSDDRMTAASSKNSPARPADFDEASYLKYNPDVSTAVDSGDFESGWAHYEASGRAEGRVWIFEQTRTGRMLKGLDIAHGTGVEIGALDKPLVTRSDGDIFYVDYADRAFLRDHYREDPAVDTDKIVDVDGIWGEKTLAEAVGRNRRVDYVLASHVIEHVPDLVSWLREIQSLLGPHGSLRLAVPDRRFTFDYARRESTLAELLDAYLRRPRRPMPRQILDHYLNVRAIDVTRAWDGSIDIGQIQPRYSGKEAISFARDALENDKYHDVHCWVFTAATFVELMAALVSLGLLDMRCDFVAETRRYQLEFLVSMSVATDRRETIKSWQEVLRAPKVTSQ